jgi:septal ring factor EnvC (AmiA/AmiB activator)
MPQVNDIKKTVQMRDTIHNLDNLVGYVDKEIDSAQSQLELYKRWIQEHVDTIAGLQAKREGLVLAAGILRAIQDSGIEIKPKVKAAQLNGGAPIEMMVR